MALGGALLKTYRTYLTRNWVTRMNNLILFIGYPRKLRNSISFGRKK
jgi:hypothetical protein